MQVNINELLTKICVSRPYFNFNQIWQKKDGTLVAKINSEQSNAEGVKLPIGEAMRHLAILGLCSYAINQPKRQYYLACKSVGTTNLAPYGKVEYAAMKVKKVVGRKLVCVGGIYSEKKAKIHDVEVEYLILPEPLFERTFKDRFFDFKLSNTPFDTYHRNLPLGTALIQNNRLEVSVLPMEAARCYGHFTNYPIVPIAYLCHTIATLSCKLAGCRLVFKSFDAKFTAPPSPFQPIKIFITKNGNSFECEFYQNGKICNQLTFKI